MQKRATREVNIFRKQLQNETVGLSLFSEEKVIFLSLVFLFFRAFLFIYVNPLRLAKGLCLKYQYLSRYPSFRRKPRRSCKNWAKSQTTTNFIRNFSLKTGSFSFVQVFLKAILEAFLRFLENQIWYYLGHSLAGYWRQGTSGFWGQLGYYKWRTHKTAPI